MRSRPASRILIMDETGRVLLFRFLHRIGALAGQDYWAIPGGAVEDGESFEQAAIRELREETGIEIADPGPQIARRSFILKMPDGSDVQADERYYLVRTNITALSREGWTESEMGMLAEHRWWAMVELSDTTDTVWPKNICAMIEGAMAQPHAIQIYST